LVGSDARYKGKQFSTTPLRKGRTPDAFFDEFKPLFVGEKYAHPDEDKIKYRMEQKKKQIGSAPFRPSSPPKKATGRGNYYGTIGPKYPHEGHGTAKKISKDDIKHTAPNVLTAPSRKGTYGVPGINIGTYGKPSTAQGIVGEYTYMSEPYDAARSLEAETKKQSTEKFGGRSPFKPSSPPKRGTYGFPGTHIYAQNFSQVGGTGGVCNEYSYTPGEDRKPSRENSHIDKPWVPSNPSKIGHNSTINEFPEYVPDPLDKKLEREKTERSEFLAKQTGPVFKPVSQPKSLRQPSITINPRNADLAKSYSSPFRVSLS